MHHVPKPNHFNTFKGLTHEQSQQFTLPCFTTSNLLWYFEAPHTQETIDCYVSQENSKYRIKCLTEQPRLLVSGPQVKKKNMHSFNTREKTKPVDWMFALWCHAFTTNSNSAWVNDWPVSAWVNDRPVHVLDICIITHLVHMMVHHHRWHIKGWVSGQDRQISIIFRLPQKTCGLRATSLLYI